MSLHHSAFRRGVIALAAASLTLCLFVATAPAALAGPVTLHALRPQPIADAAWVDAAGALRSAASATATSYADPQSSTGALPVVSAGASQLGNIQLVVPVGWSAGDVVAVGLQVAGSYGDVTFASAPKVTITSLPIAEGDLAQVAGVSLAHGAPASPASAAPGSLTALTAANLPAAEIAAASPWRLMLTFPTADPNAGAAFLSPSGNGYLITLSNVRVTVGASSTLARTGGSIVVDSNGVAATIAYVAPLALSVAVGKAPRSPAGDVALPDLTITELAPDALLAPALPLLLTVTSDQASGVVRFDTTAAVSASDSARSAAPPVVSVTPPAVSVTAYGTSTNRPAMRDSITLSGIVVRNVAAGARLTVSLRYATSPVAFNFSPFAAAPDLAPRTVTVSTVATLPRIAGDNRYHTAQLAAAQLGSGRNAVVLANGENGKQGIDALAANYLAGVHDAPILLTRAAVLPPETAAGLTAATSGAAGPITVYVMGKTDSVSVSVRSAAVSALKAAGHGVVNVVEIAGKNRYATSAAAAVLDGPAAVGAVRLGAAAAAQPTAFLASGLVNADALAAGAVAYGSKLPVLLTSGTALDATVKTAITALGITQVVILGGKDRISAAVESALGALGVTSVLRIAGANRYATAARIAELNWTDWGVTGSKALIANGVSGWPDALSAGPLAGRNGYPMLTVSGTSLAAEAQTFLAAHRAGITAGVVGLGQPATVADAVLAAADAALS